MTHLARWTKVLVGMTLAVGSLSGCMPDPGSASAQDRKSVLGIQCEGKIKISGQFVKGAEQPYDVHGCWPVGTWTFTAELEDTDCTNPPVLESQYSFRVERDAEETMQYTYLNDPAYERRRMKVTSGGGGLCEGALEIYSPDGKILLNLHPALQADGTINGFGELEVYAKDQW